MKYNFKKIERKWQRVWAKNGYRLWRVKDESKVKSQKSKVYVLDMFPYPSGEGLHVGHVEGYTASDIVARYWRMKGRNVLHPMGWDAFGLPAENYAIKKKIHPSKVVVQNVKRFKEQLNSLGFSYDWSREINTTDPEYYKWTQWIFLQLFKKGLAYEAEVPVNWCPSCKTVLANEEVIGGRCERCDSLAERRNLKQWMLRITSYADRLLKDLEKLDWPERVKEMQRNWIGRSEGRLINFPIAESNYAVEVFTTRPDTIDGVTYMVLAPEHPLVANLKEKIQNAKEVAGYIAQAENKSERERISDLNKKTGVQLKGIFAVNPHNKEKIPVWISDYVLVQYGTGAIMAVPAHDERDKQFAETFHLPIKNVPLVPKNKWLGEEKINYKLRDWIFSRQRYWGEPIPIIKCEQQGNIPVPEKDLPVELPKVKNYEPTGKAESPLAGIKKWVNVKCPECGGSAKRETNTMPQWAGSNWYYLAYIMKSDSSFKLQASSFKFWLPVDIYVGGTEHAVLHLLYARFWHKFLYDLGLVFTKEPFQKLVNQGLILGPDGQKMSKSRGNVANPDDMVKKFGADSLRLYEMFMGPLEEAKPWDPRGIVGLHRFLNRICHRLWRGPATGVENFGGDKKEGEIKGIKRLLHKTIKKVTEDIENFHFNTAISALMILLNEVEKTDTLPKEFYKTYCKLLFPFVPHLAQELWSLLGYKSLLDYESWPEYDEKLIAEEEFDLVLQVNGKTRGTIKAATGISQKDAEKLALTSETVKKWIGGKPVKKVIFVKDRLINFIF